MKNTILIFILFLSFACKNTTEVKTVEMSCGQCQFGLSSQNGCDLAIRINDEAYFVDGANIDDFGDAHDKNTGFCETIRKAEVTGKVENERFIVTDVRLKD